MVTGGGQCRPNSNFLQSREILQWREHKEHPLYSTAAHTKEAPACPQVHRKCQAMHCPGQGLSGPVAHS